MMYLVSCIEAKPCALTVLSLLAKKEIRSEERVSFFFRLPNTDRSPSALYPVCLTKIIWSLKASWESCQSAGANSVRHIIAETECSVIFVHTSKLAKLKPLLTNLPSVQTVVYWGSAIDGQKVSGELLVDL